MRKIKNWISGLGVKKKLIFYAYLILSPILLLICIALLFYNYNKVTTEHLENELNSVKSLSDSVEVLQESIKDFSTYICINNEIHSLLTINDSEEMNRDAKLWLERAPMQILQDMMSIDGYIRTLAIYPENGLRPYLRCLDESSYNVGITDVRNLEIYQEVLQSDNGMVWKYVPKGSGGTYQMNRYDKIVLYREIFDSPKGKPIGFIVIGVDYSKFRKLCENALKNEEENILILDRTGGVLINTGGIDEQLEAFLISEDFICQDYRKRETCFTYGAYDVVCIQSEAGASIVCKIAPKSRLNLSDITYMPVLLLLGMLVGLLPLFLIISNVVTRPLRNLSKAITKFSKGDFTQQVEVTTKDEIGEVAQCFNHMVCAIQNLIDENYVMTLREKESELAALQAQINPHFLYNTLDSLYWQALETENDEIAETILALSQLFRMALSRGQKEVMLHQEMELVSYYLQIQKARFSKRLQYEISIDKGVENVKIPKLIVQPFVENAIVHGFESVGTLCMVKIVAYRKEDRVHIEIIDTGIGMCTEQINAIWEEEPMQYKKQRIGSYAIKNVKERLQLRYQENFVLEIESAVGKGTRVILEVPIEE